GSGRTVGMGGLSAVTRGIVRLGVANGRELRPVLDDALSGDLGGHRAPVVAYVRRALHAIGHSGDIAGRQCGRAEVMPSAHGGGARTARTPLLERQPDRTAPRWGGG